MPVPCLIVDVPLDRPLGRGSMDDGACPPDAGHGRVPNSSRTKEQITVRKGTYERREATRLCFERGNRKGTTRPGRKGSEDRAHIPCVVIVSWLELDFENETALLIGEKWGRKARITCGSLVKTLRS